MPADAKTMVPIFSASKATQGVVGIRLTFERLEIETCEVHGAFNKDTGVFVVKTSGTYLIQFNGVAAADYECRSEIILRVNGNAHANSFCYCGDGGPRRQQIPVVISTLATLRRGDWVDVFVERGTIVEITNNTSNYYGACNRFSAILFP